MNARERLLAAFSEEGCPSASAVACYESICLRDHFAAITKEPWWDEARIGAVATDFCQATGLKWFTVNPCESRELRSCYRYEQRLEGVWRIDRRTGEEERLCEPLPGGTNTGSAASRHGDDDHLPERESDIDCLIPREPAFNRERFLQEGRQDGATAVRQSIDGLVYSHICSPLWSLYGLLGYEGMMLLMAQDVHLAAYAAGLLADNVETRIRQIAALGADAVWIEECLTDQISPGLFRSLNLPLLQRCTDAIRSLGMKSIYYYCGNPSDRLDAILDAGADAIHVEESKKNFKIDIEDIVDYVDGRCVVFGNLDAIGVMEKGSETRLRDEVKRQLAAGRRNRNRFVMSLGSPITPETPVERIRLYSDLVHQQTG